ncbi:hypothetical protein FGB62_17g05 [Gracilaria domingensis]|nr:hypothetical protein FGB62_17g05 [Gracilaria domingensis]
MNFCSRRRRGEMKVDDRFNQPRVSEEQKSAGVAASAHTTPARRAFVIESSPSDENDPAIENEAAPAAQTTSTRPTYLIECPKSGNRDSADNGAAPAAHSTFLRSAYARFNSQRLLSGDNAVAPVENKDAVAGDCWRRSDKGEMQLREAEMTPLEEALWSGSDSTTASGQQRVVAHVLSTDTARA